jgi:o-succinylbenzoate synthase
MKAGYIFRNMIFNFPGGTSRGVLTEKPSFFIFVWHNNASHITGTGEISLIPKLSPESIGQVKLLLEEFIENPESFIKNKDLSHFPAVKFSIETALLDLKNGGNKILYPSDFTNGQKGIKINGLIWMGNKELMLKRIKEKVSQGYTCIKLKIGAINFADEIDLLKYIRKTFSPDDVELRVDANGAFLPDSALLKLNELAKLKVHSIEQPIKQGQWEEMSKLCAQTPIPIALDEELIGISNTQQREELISTIKPQYIILKPSLIGGLNDAAEWSQLAEQHNTRWWVTSALESNIGLNAIAQWTFVNGSGLPQGLGTGQIFTNNIASPLTIKGEELWYNKKKKWERITIK